MDDLVWALGLEGVSRSEVSRLCAELDAALERFRSRPLEGTSPYVWLDAKAVRVRQDGRVVSLAVVVAVGVREEGHREVLGVDVGAGETYEFWLDFLRSLVRRGLRGVHLVISDAHEGLRRALSEVLSGASWQRSRVHVMRNLLHRLPRHSQAWGVGLVRTIFAQPDQESARRHLEQVCAQLEGRVPQAAAFLREVAEDVLTYMEFPREHWTQIHSTNLVERVTRELARRWTGPGLADTLSLELLRLKGGPPRWEGRASFDRRIRSSSERKPSVWSGSLGRLWLRLRRTSGSLTSRCTHG